MFAKLYNLPEDVQILVTLDYNPDDDITNINVRTNIDGVRINMALEYEDHDVAKKKFKSFTEEKAISCRQNMLPMFKGN